VCGLRRRESRVTATIAGQGVETGAGGGAITENFSRKRSPKKKKKHASKAVVDAAMGGAAKKGALTLPRSKVRTVLHLPFLCAFSLGPSATDAMSTSSEKAQEAC
jgi:hypothetical protein